jgi:hypothetical protein
MAWRVFGVLLPLYLLCMSREPLWGDAHVMVRQAEALVERHGLEIVGMDRAPQIFFLDRDGKRYGLYPMGNTLALVPGYFLYKHLAEIEGAPRALLFPYTAKLASAIAAAAACALFLVLLRREGTGRRPAILLALALGTQTILLVYARVAYSETVQAALFLWIVLLCLRLREAPRVLEALQLGFAAGWLLNVKAVNVFPLAIVALWLLWQLLPRPRRLVAVAAASLATLLPWIALMLWANFVKTGDPFDTGYATAGNVEAIFSGRFYDALVGLILSPGKGLFAFSPILVLGALGMRAYFRARRAHALLVYGVILGVLVPHLWFHAWYGGLVWGPRYLVPVTPLLLLPAGPWISGALSRGRARLRVAAVVALGAVSLTVQVLGCSFWWGMYQRIVKLSFRGVATEQIAYTSTVFNPTMTPILGHAWLLKHWIQDDRDLDRDCPYREMFEGKVPDMDALGGVPLDLWVHEWYELGGRPRRWLRWMAAAFALALLASSAALARDLRRPGP